MLFYLLFETGFKYLYTRVFGFCVVSTLYLKKVEDFVNFYFVFSRLLALQRNFVHSVVLLLHWARSASTNRLQNRETKLTGMYYLYINTCSVLHLLYIPLQFSYNQNKYKMRYARLSV